MSRQKETVDNTIEDIKDTVDLFYQQKDAEALNKFEVVIGEMMDSMDALVEYRNDNEEFEFDEEKISSTLKDAMNSLQDGDLVLLADILQYDFLEYMQELADKME